MKYPYFIVPDVEQYRKLDPDSPEAEKLSRRIAANVGDYASLRLILGIDPPEFARFYPDMATKTPSTLDTIDSFLDKFGTNIPSGGYIPAQENITTESYVSSHQNSDTNSGNEPETLSSLLKSHRYQEALMLIERQNLNNPQKSIYFAHQMRFIKKLMVIHKHRKE